MPRVPTIALSLALAALFGCAGGGDTSTPGQAPAEPVRSGVDLTAGRARALLEPTSGSSATGAATFVLDGNLVTLTVEVEHAEPGQHALHLHEFGDCSAADASSAGGHWNPTGAEHGAWGGASHHLGDVGNLVVGADGYGSLTLTTDRWSIGDGGATDVVGRAVVVHAGADDFATQPTGAAGGRIACGVIRRME